MNFAEPAWRAWIWYPEGNPAQNAPVGKSFYRCVFVVPEGKSIASARLRVSADDLFSARLNGQPLGGGDDWHNPRQFNDLARLLKPGTNVLAVVAENKPAACPPIRPGSSPRWKFGSRREPSEPRLR